MVTDFVKNGVKLNAKLPIPEFNKAAKSIAEKK